MRLSWRATSHRQPHVDEARVDTGAAVARLPELARTLALAGNAAAPTAPSRRVPPYLADLAAHAAPARPPLETGVGAAAGAEEEGACGASTGPPAGVQDPEDSFVTVEAADAASEPGAGDSRWEADPSSVGAGRVSQSEVDGLVMVDVGEAGGVGAATEAPEGAAGAVSPKEDGNNGEVGAAAGGEAAEDAQEEGEGEEEGRMVLGLSELVLLQSGALLGAGGA